MDSVAELHAYFRDFDAQHSKCPVAIRTRELREEREQQARKKREEREAERQREEQQGAAARNSEAWNAWLDERIAKHFQYNFDTDAEGNIGPRTRAIGEALGRIRAQIRKEFEAAIDKLREEFKAATSKLHDELERLHVVDQERRELERALSQTNLDASNARVTSAIEAATVKLRSEFGDAGGKLRDELRDALDRLPVVDQERRERERALNQTNLDARDARIAGAIEAAIVKLRSEFDVAGDKLRDELTAATSKLHDEINTKLARLPLEVKTWEPVGEALDQIRQQQQARSELQTAVATLGDKIAMLRDELTAATSKLQERLARLPLVKSWDENEISYCGDVVTRDGNLYQARKDTGKEPPHRDWILLARAGRDGLHGSTPRFRDVFNAYERYQHRDIVTCDGNCYIATCDNPGLPGHDEGWKILARGGGRGPAGEVGPRGRKGERGARGEDAPTIINWTIDWKSYRAVPTMSNGTQGAVLDLRPLFEQFSEEFVLGAVDAAVQDAAKTKLLSPLY